MTTTAAPAQDAPTARPAGTGSGRLLLAIGVGVVALVGVAIALVLLLPRAEPTYPAGSPEAAFVAYLRASDADDLESAYAALSPQIRASWPYAAYVSEHDMAGPYADTRRVYIDRAEPTADDRVTLHLTLEWSSGEGLTASRWYERDVRIRMVRVEGAWYVDQTLIGTQEWYR